MGAEVYSSDVHPTQQDMRKINQSVFKSVDELENDKLE